MITEILVYALLHDHVFTLELALFLTLWLPLQPMDYIILLFLKEYA